MSDYEPSPEEDQPSDPATLTAEQRFAEAIAKVDVESQIGGPIGRLPADKITPREDIGYTGSPTTNSAEE